MDEQTERKYLIVCLRHENMLSRDLLLFWGKNQHGYVSSVYNAGLYTQEEADEICDTGDISMDISFLGIDPSLVLNNKDFESDLWMVVYKSDRVRNYIKCQKLKHKIKLRMKMREAFGKVAP